MSRRKSGSRKDTRSTTLRWWPAILAIGRRKRRRWSIRAPADQLLARAEAARAELPGPDGLLSQVTTAVLERALTEEMTGHLG